MTGKGNSLNIDGYGQLKSSRRNDISILTKMEGMLWLPPAGYLHLSIGRLYWQGFLDEMLDGITDAQKAGGETVLIGHLYFQVKRLRRSGKDIFLYHVDERDRLVGVAQFDLDHLSDAVIRLAAESADFAPFTSDGQ